MLEMHRMAGIKLCPAKKKLFSTRTEYLGFAIDENGIGMQQEYVKSILEWPAPKTVKQMNTFLGFVSYYRSFIPDISQLTNEMNAQRKCKQLN